MGRRVTRRLDPAVAEPYARAVLDVRFDPIDARRRP
jgi:hypothetical protein